MSKILQALIAYCGDHQNTEDTYGVSCDERGCGICNADSPEDAASNWFAMWEADEAHLPFDPANEEEMNQIIKWSAYLEENTEGGDSMQIHKVTTNALGYSDGDVVQSPDDTNEQVKALFENKENLSAVTLTFENGGTKLYERA